MLVVSSVVTVAHPFANLVTIMPRGDVHVGAKCVTSDVSEIRSVGNQFHPVFFGFSLSSLIPYPNEIASPLEKIG